MTDASRKPRSANPERIGEFDLLGRLGSGGLATVFLARAAGAHGFRRLVALKVLHAHLREDTDLVHQLLEEAKLAARIRHVNVVPVLDVGEDDGGAFLVMEYVEGASLSTLQKRAKMAGKSLPLGIGLRVLCDALAGLHAAHELRDDHDRLLSVVHRDFSPQNILVGVDGSARLTDFGIAKFEQAMKLTKTGQIKGKVPYMAPEQARGRPLDRRSDVWSAGVLAWEILTGRGLYSSFDEVTALLEIVSTDAPRVRGVKSDLPQALDDAVAWALTRELEQRCPSARALSKSLSEAAEELGGLADAAEVGEFVRELAAPELERERQLTTSGEKALGSPDGDTPAAATELLPTLPAVSGAREGHRRRGVLLGLAGLTLVLLVGVTIAVFARAPSSPATVAREHGVTTSAPPPETAVAPLIPDTPPAQPTTRQEAAEIATPQLRQRKPPAPRPPPSKAKTPPKLAPNPYATSKAP